MFYKIVSWCVDFFSHFDNSRIRVSKPSCCVLLPCVSSSFNVPFCVKNDNDHFLMLISQWKCYLLKIVMNFCSIQTRNVNLIY